MKFLPVQWRDKLASTNTELLEWLRGGRQLPSGFVLAARQQSAGRGRYERRWISRPGRDLTFSFLFRTRAGSSRLASLSMAAALAAACAIETFGIPTRTKWPNDILVKDRKVGGILAEQCDVSPAPGSALVVGMGVNVNSTEAETSAIDRPATSMRLEADREFEVAEVLEQVLEALSGWIGRWERGGFTAIRKEWEARCAGLGGVVSVEEGNDRRSGTLDGFGKEGQLLLRGNDGAVREVWAGDLSF